MTAVIGESGSPSRKTCLESDPQMPVMRVLTTTQSSAGSFGSSRSRRPIGVVASFLTSSGVSSGRLLPSVSGSTPKRSPFMAAEYDARVRFPGGPYRAFVTHNPLPSHGTHASRTAQSDSSSRKPDTSLLRTSGMRLLDTKVDAYERIAARTDRAPGDLIDELRMNLSAHAMDLGRVNSAWALLHELRDWLCMNALYDDLLTTVAVDIGNDIAYLDRTRQVRARDELTQTVDDLQRVGPEDAHVRRKLRLLSAEAGQAREAVWLQVNMTRNRVLITGVVLLILLITSLALLPLALPSNGGFAFIVSTALFGAMGGSISGLVGREKLQTPESDYYQQRRVIMLRPVSGAVLGVVIWLATRFGILTIFNIDSHSEHGAFLPVAFIAGF